MNLERKIDEIETKMMHLQQEVSELRAELTRSKGEAGAVNTIYHAPETALTEQRPSAAKVDWERVIGQVWLPRVFILVLLLGVLWAFKAHQMRDLLRIQLNAYSVF
ncbi:hypothetical protein LIT25_08130 [Bacillus sp. F19]|nr:hypothetical protein LIT25_08130 [Bacillus sp. F19]